MPVSLIISKDPTSPFWMSRKNLKTYNFLFKQPELTLGQNPRSFVCLQSEETPLVIDIQALGDLLGKDPIEVSHEIAIRGLDAYVESHCPLPHLKLRQALKETDSKLTYGELSTLILFIESHRGKPGYYKSDDNNICRDIEIKKDGKIYIHLNDLSKGDSLINQNDKQRTTFSIDYETGKTVITTNYTRREYRYNPECEYSLISTPIIAIVNDQSKEAQIEEYTPELKATLVSLHESEAYKKLRQIISETPSIISDLEIKGLIDFIESHRGKAGYYRADDPTRLSEQYGICRTVEITESGKIYIHLNRLSRGDKSVGEGGFKKAKFSIDYDASKKVIRTTELNMVKLTLDESNLTKTLTSKGVENITKIDHINHFWTKKLGNDWYTKKGLSRPEIIQEDSYATTETIQEYYEGGTLLKIYENYNLSPQDRAKIALRIVKTIGQMHDAGILHLDIKPGNILLKKDPEGRLIPIVIDFGFSKYQDQSDKGLEYLLSPLHRPDWYMERYTDIRCRYDDATTEEDKAKLAKELDSIVTKDLDVYTLALVLEGSYSEPGLLSDFINPDSPNYNSNIAKLIERMKANPYESTESRETILAELQDELKLLLS